MSEAIQERVDPNQPAPFDEHWLEKKQPCWVGLPFTHTLTVKQIISRYPFLSEENMSLGTRLFYGEQWQPQTVAERLSKGRPVLTFNRLPALLGRARDNSQQAEERLDDHALDLCAAILGLEWGDAQKIYNYQHSTIVELSVITPMQPVFAAANSK